MSAKPHNKKTPIVKTVNVEIQRRHPAGSCRVPAAARMRAWITTAVGRRARGQDLTVRIVGKPEMARLNQRYRGKTGPTNVLSFKVDVPPGADAMILGDIVICADVVQREAREQGKSAQAHWCHMVVHGVLHLLGYDHEDETEAVVMERKEIAILARLGFPDPYRWLAA